MTNIRTHGFDSPAQLREHWAELDDEALDAMRAGEIERQLSKLRRDVARLRIRLAERKSAVSSANRSVPWLWVTGAIAAVVVVVSALSNRR